MKRVLKVSLTVLAACLCAAQAKAESVGTPNARITWTATGLGPGTGWADSISAQVNWGWSDTRPSSASFEALLHSGLPEEMTAIVSFGVMVDPAKDSQLRFSYSRIVADVSIVRVDDGMEVFSRHVEASTYSPYGSLSFGIHGGIAKLQGAGSDYRLTANYSFLGGHYVSPSLEPSCAEIACMPMNTDTARVAAGVWFSATPLIPEPSTYLMLAVGLTGLGALRMRKTRG